MTNYLIDYPLMIHVRVSLLPQDHSECICIPLSELCHYPLVGVETRPVHNLCPIPEINFNWIQMIFSRPEHVH